MPDPLFTLSSITAPYGACFFSMGWPSAISQVTLFQYYTASQRNTGEGSFVHQMAVQKPGPKKAVLPHPQRPARCWPVLMPIMRSPGRTSRMGCLKVTAIPVGCFKGWWTGPGFSIPKARRMVRKVRRRFNGISRSIDPMACSFEACGDAETTSPGITANFLRYLEVLGLGGSK